jgi:hypothetical protein
MHRLKHIFLSFILVMLIQLQAVGQCAMCRATIENNVSNGDTSVGAGLNLGILYLLAMPYLAALVIGLLWYRHAKKRKTKFVFQGEKF